MVGLILAMAIPGIPWLDWLVVAVIVVTTVYSGVEYFIQNWRCLLD
jgi:phosphatidylglycerophosphate synthase